jgi:hypothetical protein
MKNKRDYGYDLQYDEMDLVKYRDALCKAIPELPRKEMLEIVRKEQSFLNTGAKKVADNMDGVVAAFEKYGFTRKDYISAALKNTTLFRAQWGAVKYCVDSFQNNFKDYLTMQDCISLAVNGMPEIFNKPPDTMKNQMDALVKELGTTYAAYFQEMLRQAEMTVEMAPAPIVVEKPKMDEVPAPEPAVVAEPKVENVEEDEIINIEPEIKQRRRGRQPRVATLALLKEKQEPIVAPVIATPEAIEPVPRSAPPVFEAMTWEIPAIPKTEIKTEPVAAPIVEPVIESVSTVTAADTGTVDKAGAWRDELENIFRKHNMMSKEHAGTELLVTQVDELERDIFDSIVDIQRIFRQHNMATLSYNVLYTRSLKALADDIYNSIVQKFSAPMADKPRKNYTGRQRLLSLLQDSYKRTLNPVLPPDQQRANAQKVVDAFAPNLSMEQYLSAFERKPLLANMPADRTIHRFNVMIEMHNRKMFYLAKDKNIFDALCKQPEFFFYSNSKLLLYVIYTRLSLANGEHKYCFMSQIASFGQQMMEDKIVDILQFRRRPQLLASLANNGLIKASVARLVADENVAKYLNQKQK